MKIRWLSRIRTKLFAAIILLTACTFAACGVSVWLFDGFSSLFSRTIRRDFATFGSMVRLQEEAKQLLQVTASLAPPTARPSSRRSSIRSSRPRQGGLCRRRAAPRLADGRPGRRHCRQGGSRLRLPHAVEKITAARIAAVEKRVAAAAAVLPALGRIEKAPPAGRCARARRHAPGGGLRRRPAERGGLAATVELAMRCAPVCRGEDARTRGAAVAAEMPEVAPDRQALVAIGRRPDNLFDLRERELQAIALERRR